MNANEVTWINWPIRSSFGSCWVAGKMLDFSLAGAPLSVSQDATRAVNLLYCRSPGTKNSYNLYQVYEVLIRQWPPTLCYVTLIIACWKYFSLISVRFQKYFRSFMFLGTTLLVMGVDLMQFLGIWFIKARTEESFSLTRTKRHSLQERTGLIM